MLGLENAGRELRWQDGKEFSIYSLANVGFRTLHFNHRPLYQTDRYLHKYMCMQHFHHLPTLELEKGSLGPLARPGTSSSWGPERELRRRGSYQDLETRKNE